MTWTDTKCGRVVWQRDEHCPTCHRTFTSTEAGDLHRTGPYDNRSCLDPNTVQRHDRDGNDLGPALDYIPRRDAWRLHQTDARRAALTALRDMAQIAPTNRPQTAEQSPPAQPDHPTPAGDLEPHDGRALTATPMA